MPMVIERRRRPLPPDADRRKRGRRQASASEEPWGLR
eukprot:CAMPEP_0168468314 /NCGR_PEP_ID=MMETSP0228-20121227/57643_1 /TAXON_ID=133427 /ORGANISM="Protoceratium reticulatum, Strain CCCM 535 (=CCMP 1889)" /LENGTH=36 /DNA_ID= /DNA_START= /DNA_END= /DNA_ORIENTATION=